MKKHLELVWNADHKVLEDENSSTTETFQTYYKIIIEGQGEAAFPDFDTASDHYEAVIIHPEYGNVKSVLVKVIQEVVDRNNC